MEIEASRLRARIGTSGEPLLLLDQDRARWDQLLIRRGLAVLGRAEAFGGVEAPPRRRRNRRLPGARPAHAVSCGGAKQCGRGRHSLRPDRRPKALDAIISASLLAGYCLLSSATCFQAGLSRRGARRVRACARERELLLARAASTR
jgi:hypothetical protein